MTFHLLEALVIIIQERQEGAVVEPDRSQYFNSVQYWSSGGYPLITYFMWGGFFNYRWKLDETR